jgi:hypothetical protein
MVCIKLLDEGRLRLCSSYSVSCMLPRMKEGCVLCREAVYIGYSPRVQDGCGSLPACVDRGCLL